MPNVFDMAKAAFILGIIGFAVLFCLYAWFVVDQCGWDDLVARFQGGYQYGYNFCTPQQ